MKRPSGRHSTDPTQPPLLHGKPINGLATNPTSPTPQSRKAIPALPPSSEGHTSPSLHTSRDNIVRLNLYICIQSLQHFPLCSTLYYIITIENHTLNKKQKIIFRNKLQNKLHTKDKIIKQLSKACSKNQLLNQ